MPLPAVLNIPAQAGWPNWTHSHGRYFLQLNELGRPKSSTFEEKGAVHFVHFTITSSSIFRIVAVMATGFAGQGKTVTRRKPQGHQSKTIRLLPAKSSFFKGRKLEKFEVVLRRAWGLMEKHLGVWFKNPLTLRAESSKLSGRRRCRGFSYFASSYLAKLPDRIRPFPNGQERLEPLPPCCSLAINWLVLDFKLYRLCFAEYFSISV